MNISIYARVSPTKKKQGEELAYSIEKQLQKCRKQSEVDDVTIYKEYYDEYISGKAQEYMTQFKQMIIDAKLKKFEKIYCLRVDRFGRNLHQMINTQKLLQDENIFIKFVEQSIDTSDKFGRMIMGIMASVAEWQREVIVENTTIGRDRAYKENPEKFGRPKKDINWKDVNTFLQAKTKDKYIYSWSTIAKKVNVSTATLLRRYRKEIGHTPSRRV